MSYSILERVKIRLRQFNIENEGQETEHIVFTHPEDNPFLEELIEKARKDVIMARNYPDSYSEERIETDITENYSNVIIEIVLYDYNAEGIEGETNHSENGVNQTFIKRDYILGKVTPFVKVL